MIPALVNGVLARATRGARGACPSCGDEVYARIPDHAIRHWAHIPLPDGEARGCDNARGEMTEWHLEWQNERTDLTCIEVSGPDGIHKADVITPGGFIIEFQHSLIPREDIESREQYWRKGMWVLDGTPREDDDEERVRIRRKPDQSPADQWRMFEWPRAPLLISRAEWPCWIDLGEKVGLLQVELLHHNRQPLAGNGWLVDRQWFVDEIVNGKRFLFRSHTPTKTAAPASRRAGGMARAESNEDLTPEEQCLRAPLGEEEKLAAFVHITAPRPEIHLVSGVCMYAGVRKVWHGGRSGSIMTGLPNECSGVARLYPCGWRCDAHRPTSKAGAA